MNREIKFRGKLLYATTGRETGDWVYGFYYHLMGANADRISVIDESKRFDRDGDSISIYEVDPETVGQFTGLRDKNGTEIYGGDVIEVETTVNIGDFEEDHIINQSLIGKVVFNDEFAHYDIETIEHDSFLKNWSFCGKESMNEIKVIGNIYQEEFKHLRT